MTQQTNPIAETFHRSTSYVHYDQSSAIVAPWPIAPGADYSQPGQMKEYPSAERRALPSPDEVSLSLGGAISQRGSCRQFAQTPLPLVALSTLLHNAYGLGGEYRYGDSTMHNRPVPSGGGCFPLELYLMARHVEAVPAGLHHYSVRHHSLEALGPLAQPDEVAKLFLGQAWLGNVQAIIIVTAVMPRLLYRYGDRGYRYLLIEAGHIGQNIALVATAKGLGCLSLGGFFDDDVSHMLGLDPAIEIPLYGLAAGVPVTTDRVQARGLAS